LKVVAVIRSNGERTKDLCVRLVNEQIEAKCIEITPFTEALRRCFEIGIESKADWLLTVDADVLVFPGAVREFSKLAECMQSNVFHFQGVIRDKLYPRDLRPAGHRMYRVRELPNLIGLIQDDIRVESSLVKRYQHGTSVAVKNIFGLHDFEQWYADLRRKGRVHAIKHGAWPVAHWKRSPDLDLRAAYAGWHKLAWNRPEKAPLAPDFVV
jgi:hypothetical protein